LLAFFSYKRIDNVVILLYFRRKQKKAMGASITFKPVVYEQYRRLDGTYPVRIRMTANRKSRFISTTIAVTASQLTKGMKIKDRSVLDQLDRLMADMRRSVAALDPFTISKMSPDDILAHMRDDHNGFRLDFFEFAESVINGKRIVNTQWYYRTAVNAFRKFVGKDRLDIAELSSSLMRAFEQHLRGISGGDKARAISAYPSAIAYIHGQARAMYNNEETGDIKIRNPFAYYRAPREQQAAHRNISREAVQKLIDALPVLTDPSAIFAVSHFLMSFALMGMNAADMYTCAAPDKEKIITYNRQKTRDRRSDDAEMKVRIDERIEALYERLKDKTGRRAFAIYLRYTYGTAGAVISRGLRAAAKVLEIDEPMTFYSARHTWATLAYSAGVEKAVINDCLCHVDSSMRVTDIYIAKDWQVMWKANEKVLDLFDWSSIQ
jgi:site-specific recombinase XerD